MKKTLPVLIGIIIGMCISAVVVGYCFSPFVQTIADNPDEPVIINIGDLQVGRHDLDRYTIKSKSGNPKGLNVTINQLSSTNFMSNIMVRDNANNMFVFIDLNDDGVIDTWDFSNDETICTYGKMSGYPDTVLVEGSETVVRIDGVYYPFKRIDDQSFIENNGELVEIEFQPTRHYEIKK